MGKEIYIVDDLIVGYVEVYDEDNVFKGCYVSAMEYLEENTYKDLLNGEIYSPTSYSDITYSENIKECVEKTDELHALNNKHFMNFKDVSIVLNNINVGDRILSEGNNRQCGIPKTKTK